TISSFNDLTLPSIKIIAIGAKESVPAGAYAEEAIDLLGIRAGIKAEFNYGSSVTQVLQWVENGNADVGIVYSTDALSNDKIKVVAQGPAEINANIVYPIAIIKESKHPDAAQKYIDFLFSNEAKAIFEKYGFVIASQ
ncbi:MAG: molybdate ABC transporter substrate-binding protein, partial [Dehalococcoidia bacterium]|nr:molybdate ABC transporter substrate-binding protein [Dehalococcoidia bacterium]